MVNAVLHNLSEAPRIKVVRCPVDYLRAVRAFGDTQELDFLLHDGRRFRATLGRDIEKHSRVYYVRGHFEGAQRLEGKFVLPGKTPAQAMSLTPPAAALSALRLAAPTPKPVEPAEPAEPAPVKPEPFAFHPWVSDDLSELIPTITVVIGGVSYATVPVGAPSLIDFGPQHQRWHLTAQTTQHGFVLEWIVDICHKDAVIDCWGAFVWSDRNNPNVALQVDAVFLQTGEYFVDNYARRKGHKAPVPDPTGRTWTVQLSGPRAFVDGTGLDLEGQMIAYVSDPAKVPFVDTTTWDFRSAAAAWISGRPVVGCGTDWDGNLLAALNEPRYSDPEIVKRETLAAGQTFFNSLAVQGDYYDDRPLGSRKYPGSTGDQEDFGATKGTFVTVGHQPAMLMMLSYSAMADLYRPGAMLYEPGPDGVLRPLDPSAHPNWVTWSGYTHYHTGVSPDRIGKTNPFGAEATGWISYDEEHRGQQNLAAVCALYDHPIAQLLVAMSSIVDIAMVKNPDQTERLGPARGVGRTLNAWAQFTRICKHPVARQRFLQRINARMQAAIDFPLMKSNGPVKVMAWGMPDGRKPIFWPNTDILAPWWSAWEHGLLSVGLYNLYKATGDLRAMAALRTVCTTMVTEALADNGRGGFILAGDMLYMANDGMALPSEFKTVPSRQMTAMDRPLGDVVTWSFFGILIATEVLSGPLLDRAKAAVRYFTGGAEASDRRTAEWWAAVKTLRV